MTLNGLSCTLATKAGGRITNKAIGFGQAAEAPDVRVAADRWPAINDISTETAVPLEKSFEVFQKLVVGMALFNFTRTIKGASSGYEANSFVSLG